MAFTRLELATISAQFSTLVGSLAQQATSKTSPSTMFKTGLTGNVPQVITYVSKVALRTLNNSTLMLPHATVATNHTADTRYLPAPVEKRATYMFAEEAGLLRLIDMKSGWISETNKAFQREKDIMFVDAFLGNAITSLVWNDAAAASPNPANLQLPTTFVALPAANTITAAAGSTITANLKKVLKFFEANDVNWREGGLRLYHNSKFAELLRKDPEWFTWNTAGATPNVSGELKSYLGFDFIQLSEVDVLCDKSSNPDVDGAHYNAVDKCLIAVGKPICTGIWKDFNTRISVRHDMDDAYQVNSYMMLSSARLNEWDVCVLDISALS
jgi:hypothetical protein